MMQPRDNTITWSLSLDKANTVLAILGRQPFENIADLIMDLRTQAAGQLRQFEQRGNGQEALAQRYVPQPEA